MSAQSELAENLIKNYGDDALRMIADEASQFGDDAARLVDNVSAGKAKQFLNWITGKSAKSDVLTKPGFTKQTWKKLPKPVRTTIKGATLLGVPYAGYKWATSQSAPSTELDYSNWDITPYGMPGTSTGSSVLDDYLKKQRAEVEKYYGSINPTVPGAEIYDPMSAISAQLGSASSQAMSDLANQYANTAASIKQGGVQGAASINDIYGAGAANMADVASQVGGQYGGIIPVAGAESLAPGQQIAAGQDLANYLAQNQLISAQTQGGMAELAQMLGPAYANQYALIDAQMRAQATANKALKESELRQALEMEKAGAMADITRMGIEQGYQASLSNQGLAEAIQQLATPETINKYAAEYEDLEDRDKAFYANNYGIDSPEAYVRFQLTSLAKQYGTQ